MKIEIQHKGSNLNLTEPVIRPTKIIKTGDYEPDNLSEFSSKEFDHLQGKIHVKKWHREATAICVIEYYDQDTFLGLDKHKIFIHEEEIGFVPLSFALNIPKNANKAVVLIGESKETGFYHWAGKVFVTAFISLMVLKILQMTGTLGS